MLPDVEMEHQIQDYASYWNQVHDPGKSWTDTQAPQIVHRKYKSTFFVILSYFLLTSFNILLNMRNIITESLLFILILAVL